MSKALDVLVALVPVLMLLAALRLLDSFKLVPVRAALRSAAVGCVVALLGWGTNLGLRHGFALEPTTLSRYVAPAVEETLKALYVMWLVRRTRVGFQVDAAIHGFAVGAGFAVVENIYYTLILSPQPLPVWVVRGLGTAIMHGCTTAVLAVLSKGLTDRHGSLSVRWFAPGLLAAFAMHSVFNHFLLPPLASTAVVLLVFPLAVYAVFQQSERATRQWLGTGFDTDARLLEQLLSGELPDTAVGRYLQSVRRGLPGRVVGDMVSLLQLHLELSMRAKGVLLAREAGLEVPIGPDVKARLEELRWLENAIGRTGRRALHPALHTSSRELWQLYMLGGRTQSRRSGTDH